MAKYRIVEVVDTNGSVSYDVEKWIEAFIVDTYWECEATRSSIIEAEDYIQTKNIPMITHKRKVVGEY